MSNYNGWLREALQHLDLIAGGSEESDQMKTFLEALTGERNEDQCRIALAGLEFIATLLRKNADYGSSVWNPPALCPQMGIGATILVRMSDKVSRIASLQDKEAEVAESIEDTIKDLGAYALLWLARPQES